jgi:ABC-type branched-subunit amino acid transport system substrate-binding protein
LHADGVFVAGVTFSGANVISALRARVGRGVTLIGGDAFVTGLDDVGPAAMGMYVTLAGQPLRELGPAGQSFGRSFGRAHPGEETSFSVLEAAQATEVVLEAIARSDGTRASVLREMRALQVEDGILGSFRFDRLGDIAPSPVTIYRLVGRTAPGSQVDGAVVDRVIRVPRRLLP